MKKYIFILLLSICTSGIVQSQVISLKYYTKDNEETKKKKQAHYSREISKKSNQKNFNVVEKYLNTDNFKLLGTSSDDKYLNFIGERREYYENGNLLSEVTFSFDNKPIDTAKFFYENGTERLKLLFPYDVQNNNTQVKDTLILQYIDDTGKAHIEDGNGFAVYEAFGDKIEGNVSNYKREGDWKGKSETHKYSFTETYKDGKFVDGISIDEKGKVDRKSVV